MAGAWHHAVGPRLARTLGLAFHLCLKPPVFWVAPSVRRCCSRVWQPSLQFHLSSPPFERLPATRPRLHVACLLLPHACTGPATALVPATSSGPAARTWPPRQGLTGRSSGDSTACHQAPAPGTVYIFCGRGLASRRCAPLSSNVRPRVQHCLISSSRLGLEASPWCAPEASPVALRQSL